MVLEDTVTRVQKHSHGGWAGRARSTWNVGLAFSECAPGDDSRVEEFGLMPS